jgi:hypothetical protein
MNRMQLIVCLALFIPYTLLCGQDPASRLINEYNSITARDRVGSLTYKDISGSPYYSELFTKSTVYLKDGDSASVPLRYDLYQDEIEFKRSGTIFWLIKNDVLSIRYGTRTLVPEPLAGEPGKYTCYFVPAAGQYSLYVRKKVDYSPYVPPQAYARAVPDRFEQMPDEYYLKKEGMPPLLIKNKKALLKMLSDNAAALDFIKKTKTRATDEQDLLGLVRFLNGQ